MKYKKVIIAVDESPIAEKVAAKGFELCKQLDAEIAVVSVADTSFPITDAAVTPKEMAEIIKNDFRKAHQLLIEKVFEGSNVWSFVEEGVPYEMILKAAQQWEADLIIIGTHGRSGLAHVLMGSVAEKVIRHSAIPLLVIPVKK